MSASRNHDVIALLLGLVTLAADQLTKLWIVQYFGAEGMRPPIPVVGNVLTLYYVQNTGVAFSLSEGQNVKFLLIALAFGLICFLYWHYRNTAPLWLRLGFALVLGGAIGNLLDRFTRSFVVDFIHFQLGAFNFAVFNVADSAITVGVILIALCIYRMGGVAESTSQPVESTGAQEISERR